MEYRLIDDTFNPNIPLEIWEELEEPVMLRYELPSI
jgi:hypothetical protein